jgi:hypothetical protein
VFFLQLLWGFSIVLLFFFVTTLACNINQSSFFPSLESHVIHGMYVYFISLTLHPFILYYSTSLRTHR